MAFMCKKVLPLVSSSSFPPALSVCLPMIVDARLSAVDSSQCKKAFRKDMTAYEEADEYCPHCDNQYVRPALTSFVAICPR